MSYKRLTFEARYVIYHLIGVQANNMFEKEIAYFAESFRGRLADDMLDGVMSYVENDEDPLALEILCDHLIEDAIAMNDEDRTALSRLLSAMELDDSDPSFLYCLSRST